MDDDSETIVLNLCCQWLHGGSPGEHTITITDDDRITLPPPLSLAREWRACPVNL